MIKKVKCWLTGIAGGTDTLHYISMGLTTELSGRKKIGTSSVLKNHLCHSGTPLGEVWGFTIR